MRFIKILKPIEKHVCRVIAKLYNYLLVKRHMYIEVQTDINRNVHCKRSNLRLYFYTY